MLTSLGQGNGFASSLRGRHYKGNVVSRPNSLPLLTQNNSRSETDY